MKIGHMAIALALGVIAIKANASGSGYINSKGETIYLFKDGKKIQGAAEQKREPSSSSESYAGINFVEDEISRCYFFSNNAQHVPETPSCVRKRADR